LSQQRAAPPGALMPNVLYGAAYYNEYMPDELQPGRLEKDTALMKEAGISVVRMGESTWSLWEPADGKFDYAWMDRIVDAMGKAGIKVIMGTPTYSIPTWMWKAHPEMIARPLGGASVGYGMRQNMNTDDPNYRRYAQRLISNMVSHYRDNPTVIGWQIDNETSSYGASNPQIFGELVERLKKKFGTTDALNKAWFLNYWGQDVYDWNDMPTRDNATSTSYKLEWSRFEQDRVTDFLAWQAALVRAHRRPDQFVTQDYGSMMRLDVNEPEGREGARCRREQPLSRVPGSHGRRVAGTAGRFLAITEAPELSRHRDQCPDVGMGFNEAVSAIRWITSAGRLYRHFEWRQYGGVLALALDPCRTGDLLEGCPKP